MATIQLTLEVLPDPLRDVLLVRFNLIGPYSLVVILAPHLGTTGKHNTAWVHNDVGYERHANHCLCLAANEPLLKLSCGYVGASDGWRDLDRHGRLTYRFESAIDGTVAISAETAGHNGVLALGFAGSIHGALTRVRTALAGIHFIAHHRPASPQDRWEENPGVSFFTVAMVISALVAAQYWLPDEERRYALDLADDWNERLEGWCYVRDTALAREIGVAGYYVRIGNAADGADRVSDWVQLRNRAGEWSQASTLVSLDFSYLVRLGLRSASDPRIQNTLKIVDRLLLVSTPSGPLYHRYNGDGYGEYHDGRAFDGNGVGRAWPLLVGERGHLAMLSGEDPLPYLHTMWRCSGVGGLLPEQVWDGPPIPDLGLEPGRPSGSAMPLLWAHAEFLKLLVARERRHPVEQLVSVAQRYARWRHNGQGGNVESREDIDARTGTWHWRDEVPVLRLEAGRSLLVETRAPFTIQLGFDGWQRVEARVAVRLPLGSGECDYRLPSYRTSRKSTSRAASLKDGKALIIA